MVDTPQCKLCGADEDTWDHAWAQLEEDITEPIATLLISDPKH